MTSKLDRERSTKVLNDIQGTVGSIQREAPGGKLSRLWSGAGCLEGTCRVGAVV